MKSIILMGICLMCTMGTVMAQEKAGFKKRYVNHTEFGTLLGRVKYGDVNGGGVESTESRLSITGQMFQGIRMNSALSTGLTVGMDWYKTALINPIALGARYDITKGREARLFASADAGYGFAWFQDDTNGFNTKGGLMVNPGLGMKYGKPGGATFTMGLSWKRQEVDVKKPLLWEQTERFEERVYNRIVLRIGMMF